MKMDDSGYPHFRKPPYGKFDTRTDDSLTSGLRVPYVYGKHLCYVLEGPELNIFNQCNRFQGVWGRLTIPSIYEVRSSVAGSELFPIIESRQCILLSVTSEFSEFCPFRWSDYPYLPMKGVAKPLPSYILPTGSRSFRGWHGWRHRRRAPWRVLPALCVATRFQWEIQDPEMEVLYHIKPYEAMFCADIPFRSPYLILHRPYIWYVPLI